MSRALELPLYSADSHVVEPPDLWIERMPKALLPRAPRVVRYDDTELWVVDGEVRMAVVGIQAQAGHRYEARDRITKRGSYDDIGNFDPPRYLRGLDEDGVVGAVLYPSNAHQCYRCITGELLSEVARAYNDWVLDWCSAEPKRLKAVSLVNLDEPAQAVRELERTVKAGAAAVMIPIQPARGFRYDQPRYDPLWAAASQHGVPLVMHVGGNQAVLGREPVIDLIRHATKDVHFRASIATMVLSGVFGRFPRLRLGAIEFGASWIPPLMSEMDRVYQSGRYPRRLPAGEMPSDHLTRNVFTSFQDDPAAIRMRGTIGIENIVWGNDYPHAESTYPRSREILAENLKGVPRGDVERMVAGNTVRLFGF